ncbi:MAG TPA: hypothetical protein DCG78_06980 [Anaerolineaceae bacterium]|nr:hypothetical protein [Anaerolineaceae bacterium]
MAVGFTPAVLVGFGEGVTEGNALKVGVKSVTNETAMGVGLGVVTMIGGVGYGAEKRLFNKRDANKDTATTPKPIKAASSGRILALGAAGAEKWMSWGSFFRLASLSIIHSL